MVPSRAQGLASNRIEWLPGVTNGRHRHITSKPSTKIESNWTEPMSIVMLAPLPVDRRIALSALIEFERRLGIVVALAKPGFQAAQRGYDSALRETATAPASGRWLR